MLPVLRETLNQVLSKVTVLEPASCLEPILDHLRLRVGETDDRNGNHCGPIPSHYVNAGVPRRTARKCCHLEARRNDYPLPAEDWRLSWAELVLKAGPFGTLFWLFADKNFLNVGQLAVHPPVGKFQGKHSFGCGISRKSMDAECRRCGPDAACRSLNSNSSTVFEFRLGILEGFLQASEFRQKRVGT